MHLSRITLEAVLAIALGFVHCHISRLHQCLGGSGIVRKDRNADGCARPGHTPFAMFAAVAQTGQQMRCNVGDDRGVLDIEQEHREFITAQTYHMVLFADRAAQGPGDINEESIAHLMPQGVVDVFKIIEIDEQHSEFFVMPHCVAYDLRQGLIHPVPVRQLG